jgi:hypothetical protein
VANSQGNGRRKRIEVRLANRPELRASDDERENVVEQLREHHTAGRLSTDELEERVDRAFASTTHGELDALLKDLPRLPDRARGERRRELARRAFYAHVRTYVQVMVLLVVIWALTGADYFWPVWPALGWGIGLAMHGSCTPSRRSIERQERRSLGAGRPRRA